jgi:hypothetical protein
MTKTTSLYHVSIGLPATFRAPVGTHALHYTKHAFAAAQNDRYGVPTLPDRLDPRQARIIEVEMDGYRPVKVLYRLPHCDRFDLCMAVVPGAKFVVKTIWLQDKKDNHKTLDESRYSRP